MKVAMKAAINSDNGENRKKVGGCTFYAYIKVSVNELSLILRDEK